MGWGVGWGVEAGGPEPHNPSACFWHPPATLAGEAAGRYYLPPSGPVCSTCHGCRLPLGCTADHRTGGAWRNGCGIWVPPTPAACFSGAASRNLRVRVAGRDVRCRNDSLLLWLCCQTTRLERAGTLQPCCSPPFKDRSTWASLRPPAPYYCQPAGCCRRQPGQSHRAVPPALCRPARQQRHAHD